MHVSQLQPDEAQCALWWEQVKAVTRVHRELKQRQTLNGRRTVFEQGDLENTLYLDSFNFWRRTGKDISLEDLHKLARKRGMRAYKEEVPVVSGDLAVLELYRVDVASTPEDEVCDLQVFDSAF